MLLSIRALLLSFISILACAQSQGQASAGPGEDAGGAAREPDSPVVTFTLDFPDSQPEHYSIRVPVEGLAHYRSTGRISRDSDKTDTFEFDFALSAAARDKIFRLSTSAHHFRSELDSHQKNLAFTGKKTLTYKDARETGEGSFNYSSNPSVRELTELFQNLSVTLEFGHRLDYDHRYQKLALFDELKQMEQLAQQKELIEVVAIQPILEQIVADQSVINVARSRAQQLLQGPGGGR